MDGSNAVIIDGCSQPGSDCSQFPLTIKIQVDGANLPAAPAANGIFNPSGRNSVVKGLSITGGKAQGYSAFSQLRIAYNGSFVHTGAMTLQSNFLGIAPDGTANGNVAAISSGVNSVQNYGMHVGGPNPGQGNVIGGNSYGIGTDNVFLSSTPAVWGWIIEGNYFGLDPTGTQARPNTGTSGTGRNIIIAYAFTHPTTGEPGVIVRNNKIANAGTYGIEAARSSGVRIENNEFTNNTLGGIYVNSAAAVGTNGSWLTTPAVQTQFIIKNNTITSNVAGSKGVIVGASAADAASRITIRNNSIYNNGSLGIDLANDGVTANDNTDPDAGPNTRTNFPVLTQTAAGTLVEGSYNGLKNQTFTMDYYANQTADPSGYGEGQTWIGSMNFTTDANGQVTFGPTPTTGSADNVTFTSASLHGSALDWLKISGGAVPSGWSLAATATDAVGNTSEFSNSIASSGNSADSTGRTASFQYRKQGTSTWTTTSTQPLNFPNSYDQNITGLTQDTTYEYQLIINGPAGTSLGSIGTFTTMADTDNDGVSNTIEDAAPNGGDANNDGIQDSVQMNVASFVNSVTGKYAVLELDPTCQINTVSVQAESSNTMSDANYDYPVGLMNFKTLCGGVVGFTTPVKQYYYGIQEDYVLRKYNPNNKTYFNIDGTTVQKTSLGGQPVTVASFAVTDGGILDMDQAANATIVDPAGLALSVNNGRLADTGMNNVAIGVLAGILIAGGIATLAVFRKHSA